MTDNPLSVKLEKSFDTLKLKQDLSVVVEFFKSSSQFGPYHDGSWRGITLRSFDGKVASDSVMYQGIGTDTEALKHCPYIKDLITNIGFPVNTARLLFLAPGKKIGKHRDNFSIRTGLVRLHIPITTNDKVIFYLGGEQMHWKEGELWYGNFNQIHSVENQSDETRVHLVLDCTVNETLLSYFPSNVMEVMRPLIQLPANYFHSENKLSIVDNFNGYFKIPRGIIKPHIPLLGSIQANHNNIDIQLFGLPVKQQFYPISQNEFAYLGFILKGDGEDSITSFRLTNEVRKFSISIPIKKNLTSLEKIQRLIQLFIGRILYFSFKASLFIIQSSKAIFNKIIAR